MSSTTSLSASPTATSGGGSSGASRTPNIGAIVGGALGGIVLLLWFGGLMYFAHRNNCFRRPGYRRAQEERVMFEKRPRPVSGVSQTSGFGNRPPGPDGGQGARAFGDPPKSTFNDPPRSTSRNAPESTRSNFNDPPRNTFNDPPRNTFNDPPRTTFSEPPRTNFNDPPRSSTYHDPPQSNYDNRPIAGFGDRDRGRPRSSFGIDRPRSGFGDRPRSAYGDVGRRSVSQDQTRRGFFGGVQLHSDGTGGEWEGAGTRRVEAGYGTPEMEEKTGWLGWLARAKDNAARRKRIKSEYEEDMRQMRGRSVMGSEYRG
ncbi:hypothetical protein RhiJN_26241 [Ceratobasidium sp. AG-Ba]|nr:hypothetical protein RhiJN_26241 [Ceratobasidium sp. AG-Ba]